MEIKLNSSLKLIKAVASQQKVILILLISAFSAAFITYILYNYTKDLLKERLQERIVAIVATAASEFEPDALNSIRDQGDMNKPEFVEIVEQLGRMRESNNDITYAYLMRRTPDLNTFKFVADADSLIPVEEWDWNEDGVIDEDEEIPLPGDPFDVSGYPTLRDEAFYHPVAAPDLEADQWSIQLSAYAPILDSSGRAVAIVGIDVTVDDFNQRTRTMLFPFLLFILGLIFMLTLLTLQLVRMYSDRVEMLHEVDRQKDELMSMVSHQLATPVSSVRWYLEMLHDGDVGKLTKNQKDHIGMMQNIVVGLTDLVQMILDVSRIQMGRMKVDVSDVELGAFFSDVLDVIEPKAKEKKVDLQVHLPKNLPTAKLDKRLTRMAVQNVLSNAVKYTPAGGHVDFSVAIENKQLQIAVQDTGCGIPEEEHDKVFGRLFRASNVRDIEGNGFGLYLAKGGIDSQGGSIEFSSRATEGTVFTIRLPFN